MRAFSTAVSRAIFELTQFPVAQDARLVDAALGSDAGALDFLAGGDLGFLQGLTAGDLELLDGAPALEPGRFERLLAHHVGTADLLGGDDIGLLHAPIGVCALGELGGDLDRAILLGDFDDLAPLDVENVARLRRLRSARAQAQARWRCAPLRRPRAA